MSLFMYRKQSQANLEKFNNPPAATTSSDPFPKDGPSTAGRADQRLESMLERRRREKHLDKIVGVMEKQQKELDAALAEAEIAEKAARLRMGNKASDMLIKAEERARDLGHRAVGTGDILWAMFHDAEEDRQSTAISFLKGRGVTRESVYASHRYSDNAARIVKLAAQRSSDLNKRVVGTEDLLWAMFQTDDHTHSRSFAVKRLEARGVNMELVWNQAELSPNARKALTVAVKQAKNKGQRIIETEHLMEALFAAELESGDINRLSHARHWMTTQHLPLAPSVRRRDSEALGGVGSEELEESIPRMFVVGGLAGVVETFLVQPLVFFKTMAQVSPEGLFSARNLRLDVMYRGVYVNALSIGPISAFQYGCNGILTSVHREAKRVFNESDPGSAAAVVPKETATEGMAIAALTGTLSSLVVTPAELLMISQQRSGKSFTKTLLEVLWPQARAKEGGGKLPGAGLLRGLGPTAAREAGWTFGFLGLAPIIKSGLREDSKFFNRNEVAASLTASVLAGQCSAILTQPFDTVKTLMQADRGISSPLRFPSAWDAATHLYHQPVGGGLGAFWRGIVPRSLRCIGAVFILGESQARLSTLFDAYGILTVQNQRSPGHPKPHAKPVPAPKAPGSPAVPIS